MGDFPFEGCDELTLDCSLEAAVNNLIPIQFKSVFNFKQEYHTFEPACTIMSLEITFKF